tara:strand:+ start:9710 stop:9925 length:216 start_codon:yes stop_codon:yes gene_type:complete
MGYYKKIHEKIKKMYFLQPYLLLRVRLSNNTMKVIPIALAGKDPRHVLKAWRRIEHDVDNWKMILLEDPLY